MIGNTNPPNQSIIITTPLFNLLSGEGAKKKMNSNYSLCPLPKTRNPWMNEWGPTIQSGNQGRILFFNRCKEIPNSDMAIGRSWFEVLIRG